MIHFKNMCIFEYPCPSTLVGTPIGTIWGKFRNTEMVTDFGKMLLKNIRINFKPEHIQKIESVTDLRTSF